MDPEIEDFLDWWEADIQERIDLSWDLEVYAAVFYPPLMKTGP